MELSYNLQIILTIGLCALVTYGIRLGGLLLADRMPVAGQAASFLEALPGTILAAFIAPELFRNGIEGGVAAVAIGMIMYKTGSVLAASGVGVGIVFLGRFFW